MFPLVGVGASAGGLAAASELLEQLGPAPGLAAFVVQHLNPQHASNLTAILARCAKIPVLTASSGLVVESNHVYVAPANFNLLLEGRVLRLVPRAADASVQHPIDRFFHSLAAEAGERAVAVILSGTGTDGSIGAQAVKAAGGIVLAQKGAEFSGMPEAVVSTGCVDFLLPVRGLADELRRIACNGATPAQPLASENDLAAVFAALRNVCNVDFSGYKQGTIRRRLERRMILRQAATLPDYIEMLRRDPDEAQALAEGLLVHVTSFFRDPPMFAALRTQVFPTLFRDADAAIRVWVPGCSTGEEVYSLAISVLEFLREKQLPRATIKLFGTDVSATSIDAARAARYSQGIERDVSHDRLGAFFSRTGGVYQIRKEVRELCVFARHDVTRDPPFTHMDLVSCRNLMIYLGQGFQDRLLPLFHYSLNDPGFLVLGSAETVGPFPGFTELNSEQRLYSRSALAPRVPFSFALYSAENLAPPTQRLGKSLSSSEVLRMADRLVLDELAPPGVVISNDLAILQFRGRTGHYLEPAPGAARFDLMRMARDELRLPLRRAIEQARSTRDTARVEGVRLFDPAPSAVDLEVMPFGPEGVPPHFVVLFRKQATAAPREPTTAAEAASRSPEAAAEASLRGELSSTRSYLQAVIEELEQVNEELRVANEEAHSNNEELRSTNDELQMAKEELQAANEELLTLNEELSVRNREARRLNDDLSNVLSSVEVPILLLDQELCLRRFTPAAQPLLQLLAGDVGRPLATLGRPFAAECAAMSAEVLRTGRPVQRTMQDGTGAWQVFVVRPYVTLDLKIDGTVVAVFDVDRVMGASFGDVLKGASEAILMTEPDGRICFANSAAATLFAYPLNELVGSSVEALVPQAMREAHASHRASYLAESSARPMSREREVMAQRKDGSTFPVEVVLNPTFRSDRPLVVAFITDISERRAAEREVRGYQEKLQRMSFEAAVVEERERRRIAADLHDDIGQSLALARIKLGMLRAELSGSSHRHLEAPLREAEELLGQSLTATRTLTFDLSPPILYDLGLKEALAWLAEDIEKRYGLAIKLHVDPAPVPLSDAAASLVFRAVRELLLNVLKHAQSPSASMSIAMNDGKLQIQVQDSGVGFDASTARQSSPGFGLFSVQERINRLGGSLEISSVPQLGTRVTLTVPMLPTAPAVSVGDVVAKEQRP